MLGLLKARARYRRPTGEAPGKKGYFHLVSEKISRADPTVGVTHNVGGTGGTCVVNVLRRES